MSVPLDRLYEFLQSVCKHDVLIYRYFPHGSRNIRDCLPLYNVALLSKWQSFNKMFVFCHDQETLDLDFFPKLSPSPVALPCNIYRMVGPNMMNLYDKIIMVHSELNSKAVEWFEQNGAVAVYWWSHAMIALDWFRYARLDPMLDPAHKQPVKDFLIYNRAWQGTREYRLKFAEMLVDHDLHQHCMMGFNATDGQHYTNHRFANSDFAIVRRDLEQHFATNASASSSSADYQSSDYNQTQLEIVLETLFDDQRWHLTEKTLRPIACGQPFMLLGTKGSLEYLRGYGFKTFDPLIDESYDNLSDPVQRMRAVVQNMQHIASMSHSAKTQWVQQLASIAAFNQQRFFSREFFDQVLGEFIANFDCAADVMQRHRTGAFLRFHLEQAAANNVQLPIDQTEVKQLLLSLNQPV